VTRAAWPHLVARGGGSVINTASSVAHRGSAGNLAHGAAKGAVVALTRHLAAEGAPHIIRCNSISPGAVETPALADMLAQMRAQGIRPLVPLGRIGQPEDIAYCALYLASDEASWLTAADFVVDGGVAGLRNAQSAVPATAAPRP
jgi:meso-butanediol dehydrogenase / (S,S)-butanediol dehydrogenase / diacetyl reductase